MQHYHTKQFGTQLNEMDNKLDVPERFLGHISTDLNTMENKKTTYNCLKFNNKTEDYHVFGKIGTIGGM